MYFDYCGFISYWFCFFDGSLDSIVVIVFILDLDSVLFECIKFVVYVFCEGDISVFVNGNVVVIV